MSINMKTLNGYAFDAAALGGKAPEYYIQPRNLLDNSNFRSPVNQRGKAEYESAGYTIDRWQVYGSTMKIGVKDAGVQITNSEATLDRSFQQNMLSGTLEDGKAYTGMIELADGTIYTGSGRAGTGNVNLTDAANDIYMQVTKGEEKDYVKLIVKAGKSVTVCRCAIYEGTYTDDTLPPYVPKGYAAELLECQKYCVVLSRYGYFPSPIVSPNMVITSIPINIKMRITPTIDGTLLIYNSQNVAQDGFSFEVAAVGNTLLRIDASKTAHGLTQAALRFDSDVVLSADL